MNQGLRTLFKSARVSSLNRVSLQTSLRFSSSKATIEPHHVRTGSRIGYTRLQDHYYETIQENIMITRYSYPGEDYVPKPVEIPRKPKFCGPVYDENGIAIKKRGSITRKLPQDHPVGPFNIPEIESIQVQLMINQSILNKYLLFSGYLLLEAITGERPTTIISKTNVATWKLRKGIPVGATVTLTGGSMYAFLDKLTEVVLPRIKEWNGFKVNAGDGTGNLALGFPPSSVGLFPDVEVIYDMIPHVSGFHVLINTSSYRNPNARLLLSGLQIPFVNKNIKK